MVVQHDEGCWLPDREEECWLIMNEEEKNRYIDVQNIFRIERDILKTQNITDDFDYIFRK